MTKGEYGRLVLAPMGEYAFVMRPEGDNVVCMGADGNSDRVFAMSDVAVLDEDEMALALDCKDGDKGEEIHIPHKSAAAQPAEFPNGNRQFVRVQFPSSAVAARDYCNAVANELLTYLPSTLVDLSYSSWSRSVAPGPVIMTVQLHFNMPTERLRFLLKLFAAAARLAGKVKASLIPFDQGPGGQGESFSL